MFRIHKDFLKKFEDFIPEMSWYNIIISKKPDDIFEAWYLWCSLNEQTAVDNDLSDFFFFSTLQLTRALIWLRKCCPEFLLPSMDMWYVRLYEYLYDIMTSSGQYRGLDSLWSKDMTIRNGNVEKIWGLRRTVTDLATEQPRPLQIQHRNRVLITVVSQNLPLVVFQDLLL